MIKILFGTITLSATLRLATPIIIAAVGGSFSHKAGTFNIAFECFMLFGAFFGAYGSYLTGSPMAGALLVAVSGGVLSLVFGLFVFILKANPMIISIAMNNGAWAVTTLMLTLVWGVRGSFVSPEIVSFKTLDIPVLRNIPYIKNIANNQIILVYMAYAIIIIGTIIMYKTKFGLRVRGIGINDVAAQTAGVNVGATKWIALIIMGTMVAFAGAYCPLCGLSTFSENMTAGRGFLAYASVLVGDGNPLVSGLIAVVFAYADALMLTLTQKGYPTQLIQTFPYVAVIIVLFVTNIKNFKKSASV